MVKAEDQCSWESGFCGCYGTPLYARVCESRSVVSDSLWSHGLYTVYGILYARILEWVAFPFSRGSSQPRDQTQVSHIQVDSLPAEPQGKPKNTGEGSLCLLQHIFPTEESNQVSCIAGGFFTNWAIREAQYNTIQYRSPFNYVVFYYMYYFK